MRILALVVVEQGLAYINFNNLTGTKYALIDVRTLTAARIATRGRLCVDCSTLIIVTWRCGTVSEGTLQVPS